MAEWSKLFFSSPELLAYAVGFRFASCQWIIFLTSTFILSTQIINYTTLFPIIMDAQLPHHGKSAVLPKTTSLCGSMIVIILLFTCLGA